MADASMWRKRVAAWRASEQTAAEYCERHGLTLSSLRYWSHRLGRNTPASRSSSTVRFARVTPTKMEALPPSPGDVTPAVVIEVGTTRVRVEPGVDATTVTTVLSALGIGGAR